MSNERAKFEEIKPVGTFIIDHPQLETWQAKNQAFQGEDGLWLHYAVVCTLLKQFGQASRAAALEERWISVYERLPEGNDNYLVATPDRGVEEARYVADDQDWYAVATDAYNENIELHNVTHWTLLPDPPVEDKL